MLIVTPVHVCQRGSAAGLQQLEGGGERWNRLEKLQLAAAVTSEGEDMSFKNSMHLNKNIYIL